MFCFLFSLKLFHNVPFVGLEVVLVDFEDYYLVSKSSSHHANLAKNMICGFFTPSHPIPDLNLGTEGRGNNSPHFCLNIEKGDNFSCINNFQLALLLISTLENLTCHRISDLHDPRLLMETSGKLIEIFHMLCKPSMRNQDLICCWEAGALTSIQLVILRTIFAILYTMCKDAKAAKQLSKSTYVGKLTEMVSELSIDKEFISAQQHPELENLITEVCLQGHMLQTNLSSSRLWRTFQREILLGYSLHGLVIFVTCCLHHGTIVNSTLFVLCQELFEQLCANGLFECIEVLLLKLDDMYSDETKADAKGFDADAQKASLARSIAQYPKKLSKRMIRSLGKMILVLKKGKSCCKKSREMSSRKNSVVTSEWLVLQGDGLAIRETYPPSSEVEESSESAADMEFESERQDQFQGGRNNNFRRRQCGPVVRALALRSGDPGFKTRSDHSLNLFLVAPGSTSQLHL